MIDFKAMTNLRIRIIDHDLINKVFGKGNIVPHEWFFINYLSKYQFRNNEELTSAFVMFVLQFYPDYAWYFYKNNDYLNMAMCEALTNDFIFQKKYEFGLEEEGLTKAMLFGEIATDFLIRFCNYSLINCSGQNIIITAQCDCHKRFEKFLSEGYSLQRRAKVNFIKMPETIKFLYPGVKGIFYKLPVLPTKETWFPIDEIIETETGRYEKVLCLNK